MDTICSVTSLRFTPINRPNPFPPAHWGDSDVVFEPLADISEDAYSHPVVAAVVFAIHPRGFLLADIPGRGWCVPSGRLEPGESPLDTAIRETYEEVGAELVNPRRIGVYTFRSGSGAKTCVPAFVGWVSEPGPLPSGSESLGVCVLTRDQLPESYWLWDDLMARVFDYALECAERFV
jgi:8-oxo-dGTP diphosphatase